VLRLILRRLVLTIPVLLGVATVVFALIHLVPGDPAQAMLDDSSSEVRAFHQTQVDPGGHVLRDAAQLSAGLRHAP
jgi:ABC-type dipeptide/oligopeptide/nickel transport system permease component